ncbi:MAG: hypothetical protein FGM32_07540 [Candidatus Kapabacteria bacterium]|nr:hypothetical protein [Candidatus Kapabacteria bacterium]
MRIAGLSFLVVLIVTGTPTIDARSHRTIRDSLLQKAMIAERSGDTVSTVRYLSAHSRWMAETIIKWEIDSAVTILQRALALAERRRDKKLIATTLVDLGYVYDLQLMPQPALTALRRALTIGISLQRDDIISLSLSGLARVYYRTEDSLKSSCYSFVSRSLMLAERYGDKRALVLACIEMSRYYHARNDFARAHSYDSMALEHAAGDRLLFSRARYLRNNAIRSFGMGNYEQAIELWKGAIRAARHSDQMTLSRLWLVDIASSYWVMKRYEEAERFLDSAIVMSSAVRDSVGVLGMYCDLARLYSQQGKFALADSLLRSTAHYASQMADRSWTMATVLYYRSEIADRAGRLTEGVHILRAAAKMLGTVSARSHHLLLREQVLVKLVDAYHRLGRWKDAFQYGELLQSVRHQRALQNDAQQIQLLNDFHAIEREQAMRDLYRERERTAETRVTAGIIVVVLMLVVIAVLVYALRRRRQYTRQLDTLVAELRHEREELKERNRDNLTLIREREEILAIAAHDIKNPLLGVRMAAMQMSSSFSDVGNGDRRFDAIVSSTERVLRVVSRLLSSFDVARLEAPSESTKGPIDIAEYTMMVIEDYEDRASIRGIRLVLRNETEHPIALEDRDAYHEILDNLVSNAVKYAPVSTTVTISINREAASVHVSVHDIGTTLSVQDGRRIFDPKTQGTGSDEMSHGVGLYAAQRTAQTRGWNLSCQVGDGTRFTLVMSSRTG